ncbi:pickpocket 13 [Carabus blaptoides fortunei]
MDFILLLKENVTGLRKCSASWDDFQHNAISFVVETNYLEWDTQFPAVAVCEYDNQHRIAEVTDSLYGDPHDYNLDEIVKELVYFRGLSYYTIQLCGPNVVPNENCLKSNFSFYSGLVRSSCKHTFRTCRWNDEIFDCCEYFTELDTELGLCYAINSAQARNNRKKYPMISNRRNGPGNFYIEVYGFVNIYILGEQEVPSLTTLQTDMLQVSPHIHYHRYMAIKEIDNDEEVRDVEISQRNCRFMEENNLDVYHYYSYSACCVQCRKNEHIRFCNCTHHLMPNSLPKEQCNLAGMACLNENYNELAVLKAHWAKRTGLICDCLPSCTETEMFLIKDEKTGIKEDFAAVEFTLERLPSERFKRNVVHGKLDLVVSMGGTAGLFMGASLLSFVEVLYYFFPKALWDTYITRRNAKQIVNVKKTHPLPFIN